MMAMAFVEFENVSKIYKTGEVEISALHGASFTVEQGEICVIVGASGAGKTTLLNILGGMDTLTSGTVKLDGAGTSPVTTAVSLRSIAAATWASCSSSIT